MAPEGNVNLERMMPEQRPEFWIESMRRIAHQQGTRLPFPHGFVSGQQAVGEDGRGYTPVPPAFYASPTGHKLVEFLHAQVLGANPSYTLWDDPSNPTQADWVFENRTHFRDRSFYTMHRCVKGKPVQRLDDPEAQKERKYSRVILMGCGVDSTLAVLYAHFALRMNLPKTTLLLYVDYHGPYSKKESLVALKLLPSLSKTLEVDTTHISLNLSSIPQSALIKGYILPLRNAMLAGVAASFLRKKGGEIWIGANYRKVDDDPGAAVDKSRRFFGDMTELLSAQWGRPARVMSPFLHLSKAETVRWAMSALGVEMTQWWLSQTTTCYHPTERRCGSCYACFKLAMMVKSTGLELDGLYLAKVEAQPDFRTYLQREAAKGRKLPTEWAALASGP